MKNAFWVLGATPEDSSEKLKELFDEKQLFCDDDKDLELAYSELINVKKRIKHEIRFLTSETFENFDKLFFDNADEEQEIVIEDMCKAIIEVGKWFDLGINDLFIKINESRKSAKFTPISNQENLQDSINELRSECILAVKKYFDYFKEKDIVLLFNTLVKQDDYMSFFVDDLLSIYEDALRNSIEKKEKDCSKKFELIEQDANSFLDDDDLSLDFSDKINNFKKSLLSWDKIVQPLQVNFANRGGQHEISIKFASTLRNKVIDMCNKSQESLQGHINYTLSYDNSAKQEFVNKTVQSINFIDYLMMVLNILQLSFAEIDVFNERLKKDRNDFENLKKDLNKILDQIDPYNVYRNKFNKKLERKQVSERSHNTSSNTYSNRSSSSSTDKTWTVAIRWILGITILVSLIGTIVSFASDGGSTGVGIISGIIFFITSICAYKWGQLDIKLDTMKSLSIILALIMFFVCIVSLSVRYSSSGGYKSSGTSYTITFNKQGGTGGTYSVSAYYGEDMPYATKPSKTGYTFEGYYSSSNGNGTKYYDAYMNSVKKWDHKYSDTLYAYWTKNGTKLTSSNFLTYFTVNSSCSVSSSGYSRTATYTYSISPKSSFHYSLDSDNPSSISVTIGLDISSYNSSYGTPSEYKIYLTLYKSNGYKTSGSRTYTISSSEKYWNDGIYSVSGTIYN